MFVLFAVVVNTFRGYKKENQRLLRENSALVSELEQQKYFINTLHMDIKEKDRQLEVLLEESRQRGEGVRSEAVQSRGKVSERKATTIDDIILRESMVYGIDPRIIEGIVRVESNYKADTVGSLGEIGLMQILPSTGKWIATKFGEKYSRESLFRPEVNIKYGVWYFNYLIGLAEKWGYRDMEAIEVALLCYNRGEGNVRRDINKGKNPSNGYEKEVLRDW